jgi:ribosomal protein L37AE/L43A
MKNRLKPNFVRARTEGVRTQKPIRICKSCRRGSVTSEFDAAGKWIRDICGNCGMTWNDGAAPYWSVAPSERPRP